jgi:TRAP-type C4-dicarboxylate transport system permease small subunit
MRHIWESSWIWLGFAVVFAALGSYHFWASTQATPLFEFQPRPITQIPGLQITMQIAGIDQPIQDFTKQFNAYVQKQNSSMTLSNIASAWGFVVAFLAALLAFFRETSARKVRAGSASS